MPNRQMVRHTVGECVNEQAYINGMESFWSMLKRGYYGDLPTYHRMSPAHLQRYVDEFSGRYNQRGTDTEVQMHMIHQWWSGSGYVSGSWQSGRAPVIYTRPSS